MDGIFIFVSLMFIVQIVTNVIVLVKVIPLVKRKTKPKVNISDIMALASQVVGGSDEPV